LKAQPDLDIPPGLKARGGLDLSILSRLSPEPIIYTTRFLSPDSAASFAFCCRSIYAILGTRYWESLRTRDQQKYRLAFLTLLEKDLLKYIVCHLCEMLNLSQKESDESWVNQPVQDMESLKSHAVNSSIGPGYIHTSYIGSKFGNLQMAMKYYCLGLPYSDYLSFLGCDLTWHIGSADILPFHCRAHSKIVARSLILRMQYALLIPPSRSIHIPTRSCFIGICYIETRDLNFRLLAPV
jgi:hypothetical protein